MAVLDPQGEGVLADGKVGHGQGEGFRVAKVAVPAGVPGVVGDGAVGVIDQHRKGGVPEDFRVLFRKTSGFSGKTSDFYFFTKISLWNCYY